MSTLTEKREQLIKEKQELTEVLKKLDSEYKLGIRNLDRIEGALFILDEAINEESKTTDTTNKVVETVEPIKESK